MNKRKFTLEQARILTDKTQAEMSVILCMSEKTYIQYEKYRRIMRMDQAHKFIVATGFEYDELIFFKPELRKIRTNRKIA